MKLVGLAAAAFSLVIGAGAAYAQTITANLTQTQANLGAGPFGTVTVTQSGANLNFSYSPASGYRIIDTGAHYAFAFNLTGGGSITNLASNFAVVPGSDTNPPYGPFNYLISCSPTGGGGCGNQLLTFTVQNALLANFVDFSSDTSRTSTGQTGAAFGTVTRAVPGPIAGAGAPALAALLGGWWLRRRRTASRAL